MEVILKQQVDRLGEPMAIVKVSDGYARNFLIPRNLAVVATPANKKAITEDIRRKQVNEERETAQAKVMARKLESVSVTIAVKVGEDEKIFGSVTDQMICDALKAEGIEVQKKDLELEEPIKALGVYSVPIRFSKNVVAKIKVWVVKEAE